MNRLLIVILSLFCFSSFAQEIDIVLKIRDIERPVIEEYRQRGTSLVRLKEKKALVLQSLNYEIQEKYKGILFIGGTARFGSGCISTIILCTQLNSNFCGGDGKITIKVEENSLFINDKNGFLIIDNRNGDSIKSCN
ncbi:MAG: hypothetical protein N4A33_06875 [Bacteriovoracaceae bacterium]|nr:hypothetical protein [Bacteriovoracaceae bacterium]